MGLAGFAPAVIKPTAPALNVLVSAIGCVRFYRLSLLTWRSAYPFAFLGLPSHCWEARYIFRYQPINRWSAYCC
jgi:hypothetical protein